MTALSPGLRYDHQIIAKLVSEGDRVLDVGCGEGDLMALLTQTRGAAARGLEISAEGVSACMAKGLAVVQGDADHDLAVFPADAFDAAILSKTLQEMRDPRGVLEALARVAPRLIISFRNYGFWRFRAHLLTKGRMPTKPGRPWFSAEAIHPCSVRDMADLVDDVGLKLERVIGVDNERDASDEASVGQINVRWPEAIMVATRRADSV